jgi:regulatory protein YycI of two-component signal transduction system YycFG
MNAQSIELIYYIAEIVSVIAVVISLIYVGKQVRQNTQAVKNNTLQNISENQISVHGLLAAHGELAEVVFRAATGTGSDEFRDFVDNTLMSEKMPEGWKVPGS